MTAATAVQLSTTFNEKLTLYNHTTKMLARYGKFANLADFNKNWAMIMAVHKKEFTKLQHAILNNVIKNWAATVPGVANACYSTYMNDCEKRLGHKVSRDAVREAIDKAESLGILIKCFGKRLIKGRGSQTANVLIFNPYEEVCAYKIAQEAKDQEEIERLLDEEYAAAQRILNWGKDAKKIAADRAQKNVQPQQQQQPKTTKTTKTTTLYKKIVDRMEAKKMNMNAKGKYMGIVYGLVNKKVATGSMTKAEAEQLAYEAFEDMSALPDSKIKKNREATLSAFVKNKFKKAPVSFRKQEIVPEWFNKSKEERAAKEAGKHVKNEGEIVSFEEERRKIMEKLGRSEQ